MAAQVKERTFEETATWAVAVVCFVLLAVSIAIEHLIHAVGQWFKKKGERALYEALKKVKGELMLLGFISLLLTLLEEPICSNICISEKLAATWHPCEVPKTKTTNTKSDSEDIHDRKLLQFLDPSPRRVLATKGYDKCADKGKVAFVSAYAIHQLHIFICVLAIFHVLQCIITLTLARTKMRRWKAWENETKTVDQFHKDPENGVFAWETAFVRRHDNIWTRSPISLWIVCFFRQLIGSVTKADYMALWHGINIAHSTPGSEATIVDLQKNINTSLDEDLFKVVVGISPIIWFTAVLFLLTNTNGWRAYLWFPFIPFIIILLVGAKLQTIITKMALRIQERGDVVNGTPVVEPGDQLFWFNRPCFLLFLIHLVLFQNAFGLAFFIWSTYEFSINSCFHRSTADIVIRLTMGVVIQFLCSYVTLPLYALVMQMGSIMKANHIQRESSNSAEEVAPPSKEERERESSAEEVAPPSKEERERESKHLSQ